MNNEQTLSIIKPDAVESNLSDEIKNIFIKNNLSIKDNKKIHISKDEAAEFYKVHQSKPFYNDLCAYLSSGPIVVGTFATDGSNAGVAGYFSGYDTVPEVDVEISGGGCLNNGTLEESSGDTFDAYQWYKDGVAIAGATGKTYTPTQIGDYYIEVPEGGCSYNSSVLPVYYCYPDINVIKNADVTEASDGDTITYTITV